ncbi:hypothetical protein EON82_10735 [bacterium]|nr:MAG: hypothetical protein EON82_10735 [bacterium]
MERHEDPARALRAAAWRVLGALAAVLLVAVVLFPIFAQARESTGKPNPHLWVAEAIQVSQLVRRDWPTHADEVRPYLQRGHRALPGRPLEFSISPKGPKGSDAVYEISIGGRTTTWRVKRVDAPRPEAVRE